MDNVRWTIDNDILFPEIVGLLKEGHTVTLQAKGGSMFPFIVEGRDKVVLQKANRYRKSDIVLACLPEKGYVLHRIYRLSAGTIHLMGDGNLYATECCQWNNIQGKVIQIIRNGKTVDCDAARERWRARLWQWLLPLRRIILGIYKRYANKGMH